MRNKGNLRVHEKWMSTPRNKQKFEIQNKNDYGPFCKILKYEIEIEKLKIDSIIEQNRRKDMAIEEITHSKCSDQEADFLFEQ